MHSRTRKDAGMTLMEVLVVIAILGIFMALAIPSITRSFRTMERAKILTSRYPDAWRALDRVSSMVRQTYPAALAAGGSFVGRHDSYELGGMKIPSDELSFPVLDTGLATSGSVQEITYRLELSPPSENAPTGLVQTRSALGATAETGLKETILKRAIGLDFSYLDDSVNPPQWVPEWPPAGAAANNPPVPSSPGVAGVAEGAQAPAAATPQSVRVPQAVKVTVYMVGAALKQPITFTTVVNVRSR